MKKALFTVCVFAMVVLVGVLQATAQDATDEISVFAAVEETGVAVTPEDWIIGVVGIGSSHVSPQYTATNLGTVTEDFAIEASDVVPWICGASGPDSFAMGFDPTIAPPGVSICTSQVLANSVPPGNTYVDPVVPPGTSDFFLHFTAPTSVPVAAPGAIIVTVTATATP